MKKSHILEMTWEEFRDSVDSKTVVVIPMGSTELEGLHLPLGVDTIVAEGVARNLAGEEGVLIGPLLPIGYSKWFNPFPGTISLEHETLIRLLLEYCTCLINHGIKRLVFLNSHRGNNATVEVGVAGGSSDRGGPYPAVQTTPHTALAERLAQKLRVRRRYFGEEPCTPQEPLR